MSVVVIAMKMKSSSTRALLSLLLLLLIDTTRPADVTWWSVLIVSRPTRQHTRYSANLRHATIKSAPCRYLRTASTLV